MELGGKPLHEDHIEQIIPYVPPRHLRSLSLTSTTLRNLTSKPKLWKNMKVNKPMIRHQGLPQLFAIKKFEKVRVIDMSDMLLTPQQLIDNLNAISSSSVQELILRGVDIPQVPAALLGEVAGKLIKLDLGSPRTMATPEQSLAVLKACASSTTMSDLSLTLARLSSVPPQLLAQVVGRLQKLDLSWSLSTPEQSLAVLEACASSSTMTDLSLTLARLSSVPPQLLAQVVGRLQKLDLSWSLPTPVQCLAILEASASSTILKELSLFGSQLSALSPPLLAQAVRSLQKVNLGFCNLSRDQCTTILEACAISSTRNDVDLSWNSGMSQVSVDLLRRAVCNLARVNLRRSWLSTEQCLGVMEASISSSKLISVNLDSKGLRGVSHQKLKEAAENLQAISLDGQDGEMLAMEQILAVLQASASSLQLTDVSMRYQNLKEVPIDDLTQAVTHLEHFDLWEARMTIPQKTSVLQAIIASTCKVTMKAGQVAEEDIPALLLREARETGRLVEI